MNDTKDAENIDTSKILKVLEGICINDEQKTSDRITAAKLLLEHIDKSTEKSDGSLTVAFENIPQEFYS